MTVTKSQKAHLWIGFGTFEAFGCFRFGGLSEEVEITEDDEDGIEDESS